MACCGSAMCGMARSGLDFVARRGTEGYGMALARYGYQGMARRSKVRRRQVGRGFLGAVRQCPARLGQARYGLVRQGMGFTAWFGEARWGMLRHGF